MALGIWHLEFPVRRTADGIASRWIRAAGLFAGALAAAAGCAPPQAPRPDRSAPSAATVRSVAFQGWRSCPQLDNGLVRATQVPQVGGRTLEYRFAGSNFLFLGRRELGATLGDTDRAYRAFGGHFAQLHPQERWQSVLSTASPTLYMGRYSAKAAAAADSGAAVEMAAPTDLPTGTRLVRRVELFPGSTRLHLADTLTNIQQTPQEWGIQDVVQLKGVPSSTGVLDGRERAMGRIALYVPTSPGGRLPGGYRHIVPTDSAATEAARQWTDRPGLLTLRYRRLYGGTLVDPALPWIALADETTGTVFVQWCQVPQKFILTAGPPLADYPFIELQSLAPVATLGPGQSTTLVQDWYATACPGPIVDATPAGVVSAPLSLLRGDGRTWVAGRFGVFCVGDAAVVFRGADGSELRRLGVGAVHPLRPFALNTAVELPPATAEILLEVRDAAGRSVGHLGRIVLGGK